MSDEIKDNITTKDSEISENKENAEYPESHSDYNPVNRFDAAAVHHLSGMYQTWFLDYASYSILDRAVPHLGDGLKPVQRRILHSMKRMDDGRYNKVANIVGHTMQFHPHGDASIGDALVQMNKEPITLPVKFPLVLAQGAEGIAVGLSTKILPHNFCELCDAAIAYLNGEPFQLYPDFPTSGSIDVSKYNDGQRGGSVKVRAKIEKIDQRTLVIREIPFSKTSETLQDSIVKAEEKGKIKAKKVEDLTAANVEIQVHRRYRFTWHLASAATRPLMRSMPSPTVKSASRPTVASSKTTSRSS